MIKRILIYCLREDGIIDALFGMLENFKVLLNVLNLIEKPIRDIYGPLICGDGIDIQDDVILTSSWT